MSIYIEYKGIKGDATEADFKGYMKVDDFSFDVSRNVSMDVGDTANRNSGRPQISVITFTKKFDGASIGLFNKSLSSDKADKVKIKVVETDDKKKAKTYLDYELTNVIVSHYSISSTGDEPPVETVQLSYTEIMLSFKSTDSSNAGSGTFRTVYDLEKGTVSGG